jgi:hypothetical protein
MKSFFVLFSLILLGSFAPAETVSAQAKDVSSVTLSSADSSAEQAAVPVDLVGVLMDSGVNSKLVSPGVVKLEVRDVSCEQKGRNFYDPSAWNAMVPSAVCTIGNVGSLRDSRSFLTLVLSFEKASGGKVVFGDCSMGGHCATHVNLIDCTIKLAAESMAEGRFVCTMSVH